jgi:hypothetical protein
MSIDSSYVAVVLSCALVNVVILALWGLLRVVPWRWLKRVVDLLCRMPWHHMPER